jgi:hypothetical protein
MCPTIISSRSRGKGFSYAGETTSPKKSQLRGIQSLNKIQQGIIRIMVQYPDESPIELKGILLKW